MALTNNVTLRGFLGSDPQVRTAQNGSKVAKFSLATNERLGRNTDGTPKDHTEWHQVTCFSNTEGKGLAETVEKHLKKGSHIALSGRLRTNSYEKQIKDGDDNVIATVTMTRTEIHLDQFDFLPSGKNEEGEKRSNSAPAAATKSAATKPRAKVTVPPEVINLDDVEDDQFF